MAEESVDISNPVLGSLKVSGPTVNNIFTVFTFVLLVLLCWVTWSHHVEAKDSVKEAATVLKESNAELQRTLKENTKELAEALKQMGAEQKRSNEIQREQTCLLTLPPDRRTNAADFCKRISRDGR